MTVGWKYYLARVNNVEMTVKKTRCTTRFNTHWIAYKTSQTCHGISSALDDWTSVSFAPELPASKCALLHRSNLAWPPTLPSRQEPRSFILVLFSLLCIAWCFVLFPFLLLSFGVCVVVLFFFLQVVTVRNRPALPIVFEKTQTTHKLKKKC